MIEARKMRAAVIKDRIERHDAAWRNMFAFIDARNAQHRILNKKYGFSDSDGTFGIGKKSHVDKAYVAEYDEIQNSFRVRYDNESKKETDIDNATLSIFEYLLFDNASKNAVEALHKSADADIEDSPVDFIRVRAQAETNRWNEEYTAEGIREMIKHERRNFVYRARGCRKNLRISLTNLAAIAAISNFKKIYLGALERAALDTTSTTNAYENARRTEVRQNIRLVITIAVWGVGASVVFLAWEWQKTIPGGLGEFLAFIIYIVAFFYVFALVPIRIWIDHIFGE